jgi:hypothetical protein
MNSLPIRPPSPHPGAPTADAATQTPTLESLRPTQVIVVESGDRKFYLDLLSINEEPGFFAALKRGDWGDIKPPADGSLPRLALYDSDPAAFEYVCFWLKSPGRKKLPRDLSEEMLSRIKTEAKRYCLDDLRRYVKNVYRLEQRIKERKTREAESNSPAYDAYQWADTLAPDLSPAKVADKVNRALPLDPKGSTLRTYLTSVGIHSCDPAFLRLARHGLKDMGLIADVQMHLAALDRERAAQTPEATAADEAPLDPALKGTYLAVVEESLQHPYGGSLVDAYGVQGARQHAAGAVEAARCLLAYDLSIDELKELRALMKYTCLPVAVEICQRVVAAEPTDPNLFALAEAKVYSDEAPRFFDTLRRVLDKRSVTSHQWIARAAADPWTHEYATRGAYTKRACAEILHALAARFEDIPHDSRDHVAQNLLPEWRTVAAITPNYPEGLAALTAFSAAHAAAQPPRRRGIFHR